MRLGVDKVFAVVILWGVVLFAVVVGCSSGEGPPPILEEKSSLPTALSTPTVTTEPDQNVVDMETTDEPTPLADPVPTPNADYESVVAMAKIYQGVMALSFQDHAGAGARYAFEGFEEARINNDTTMVPVVIGLLRYMPTARMFDQAILTIKELTNQDLGSDIQDWPHWAEWLGQNLSDYPAPAGYIQLKRRFFSSIDEGFDLVLESANRKLVIHPFELMWGGVPPDGIPALEFPPTVASGEQNYLRPDDRVFGVSINGEHRAYPLRIMNAHEMANDTLGSEPITLAYCVLCGTGIAFSRKVNGIETTFGTSGLLFQSNKVMYDRETLTLWHQGNGQPISGDLTDTDFNLDFFPTLLTTWEEWLEEHPDTTVLSIETGVYPASNYQPESDSRSIYYEYFKSPETMFPVPNQSGVLQPKEVVLTLSIGDARKAYQVEALNDVRLLNDSLADTKVVVLASGKSQAARIYERDTHQFSLISGNQSATALLRIVDEDGEEWIATEDALINSESPDEKLVRIPTHYAFWFSWFSFNEETELYRTGN